MNIFFLDRDPAAAARLHCDKHVGKMLVEAAQMMSTALRLRRAEVGYRVAYANHPVTLWVRAGAENYRWTLELADALAEEFRYRFGRVHRTSEVLGPLRDGADWRALLGPGVASPPPLCMPDAWKVPGDPVASYRAFYRAEKAHFARYTRRPVPDFMIGAVPAPAASGTVPSSPSA
ncbi:pyrimidine dimer DNA glycosylase/endonuclease V [Azospirillum thermophilum]|uniref:Uncharacterized protein n=1 Tax=Azospirillum thermophilum TaxID=2202148 RepID=A0A2S2CT99_9PROT|nr:pyrimidine dimer DNA glycosylase/endonuclease V [Azospirillum thermophilum]AWK87734.1 hypothetical protein DEW08_17370 [Azospirillum thermophilum]